MSDMDQESFESLIKAKFDNQEIKPPKKVWQRVSVGLTDVTLLNLELSHFRLKLVAAAAIVLAILSFGNQIVSNLKNDDYSGVNDFNALTSNHFDNQILGPNRLTKKVDLPIVWVIESNAQLDDPGDIAPDLEPKTGNVYTDLLELESKGNPIYLASVEDSFDPYYRISYNSLRREASRGTVFWAGVEAGAGNLNSEIDGSSAIDGSVNFNSVADAIGQSGFVNPTSSANQVEVGQGLITSLGVDFGLKMGRKWTLESGLQYSNIQNQSIASLNVVDIYTVTNTSVLDADELNGNVPFSARTTQIEDNYEHSVELDNNIRFTSIPLKAGYFVLDSKFSMRLNAGLTANYLLSSSVTDPSNQIENPVGSELNSWTFDGLTGIEFGYSLNRNFNLTLEPNYRQSITPLSSSLVNRNGFMLQTGIRYNIH